MISSPATAERPITFSSRGQPSFLLEGMLHTPIEAELAPIIILCHPHQASSDMDDMLNLTMPRRLAETWMIDLTFNFRGVRSSQSKQTDGRLEPLDLAVAID